MNSHISLLVSMVQKTPPDADVKAGWVAFWIFVGLCVAVAFLGFSLTKQLKKTKARAEEGVFDPSDPKPQRHPPIIHQ